MLNILFKAPLNYTHPQHNRVLPFGFGWTFLASHFHKKQLDQNVEALILEGRWPIQKITETPGSNHILQILGNLPLCVKMLNLENG